MEIQKQKELLNKICPLKKGYVNSRREVRVDFFNNIQTEIQAYLLGFYVADGSINDKRHTLRIKVNINDLEIPKLFVEYICPKARQITNKPFKMIGTSGKEILIKETFQIDITNKNIYESLNNLGYGANKTYHHLHIPNLPDNLIWAFIRGYFDGDGCITGSIRYPNIKNREKNIRFSYRVEWVSKTSSLLEDIQKFLLKYNINSSIRSYNNGLYYRLNIGAKNDIKTLFNYMYNDCNFCLKRKYNKFKHYVNTETSQFITERCNA